MPAFRSLWQRVDHQLADTAGADLDTIRAGLSRILDQLKTAEEAEIT